MGIYSIGIMYRDEIPVFPTTNQQVIQFAFQLKRSPPVDTAKNGKAAPGPFCTGLQGLYAVLHYIGVNIGIILG